MTDIYTKDKRSEIMSKVKSDRNKATELKFILFLRKNKLSGWRRRFPAYGKPDFVFPDARIAVFIDGCFWHGCQKHGTIPETNVEFWETKINGNIKRDKKVSGKLRANGWHVIRVWQHDLTEKNIKRKIAILKRLTEQ